MRFEAVIVVLMNVQLSFDMTTCRLVSTDVSECPTVSEIPSTRSHFPEDVNVTDGLVSKTPVAMMTEVLPSKW
jgi:hypothetical protein